MFTRREKTNYHNTKPKEKGISRNGECQLETNPKSGPIHHIKCSLDFLAQPSNRVLNSDVQGRSPARELLQHFPLLAQACHPCPSPINPHSLRCNCKYFLYFLSLFRLLLVLFVHFCIDFPPRASAHLLHILIF